MKRMPKSYRLFLWIVLWLCALSSPGCVDYRRDFATHLILSGSVNDKATGAPLSGAGVSIRSDRMIGKGQEIENVAVTDERGEVVGEYSTKWGCRQNGLWVWLNRNPKVDVAVCLRKCNYQSELLTFRLDRLGGDVSIDIGLVSLSRVNEQIEPQKNTDEDR